MNNLTEIKPGQIVYCDLELETMEKKPVKHLLKNETLSRDYDEEWTGIVSKYNRILTKAGIKTDCKIINILIHHSSGYKIKYD